MAVMHRRTVATIVSVLGILAVTAAAGWALYARTQSDPPDSGPQSRQEAAKPAPSPLFIDAIRQREYQGSPIAPQQELGSQGGYVLRTASYVSDGFTQYFLEAEPAGAAPPGGWPVVILCHGYIPPAEYRTAGSDYQSWIAAVARAGYLVLKPDFRGHGSSQGSPTGGHFSPDYTYDVLNLMASLKQYPKANASKVALVGHSMGAHVALKAAVASPDVKSSIYISGVVGTLYDIVYNWPRPATVPETQAAQFRSRRQQLYAQHGDPKTNAEFWDQATALNYVRDAAGPLQIHHGTNDAVVPVLFSQHLAEAAQRAKKPVEYYEYPGGDHQFSIASDRQQLLQRILAFLGSSLR